MTIKSIMECQLAFVFDLLAQWAEKAVARLEEVFLDFDYKNIIIWRMYLPHVNYSLKSDLNDKGGKNWIDLAWNYGACLYSDGRWDEAEVSFVQWRLIRKYLA